MESMATLNTIGVKSCHMYMHKYNEITLNNLPKLQNIDTCNVAAEELNLEICQLETRKSSDGYHVLSCSIKSEKVYP